MEFEHRAANFERPQHYGRLCRFSRRPPATAVRRSRSDSAVARQNRSRWTSAVSVRTTPADQSKLSVDPGDTMERIFDLSLESSECLKAIQSWIHFSGRIC